MRERWVKEKSWNLNLFQPNLGAILLLESQGQVRQSRQSTKSGTMSDTICSSPYMREQTACNEDLSERTGSGSLPRGQMVWGGGIRSSKDLIKRTIKKTIKRTIPSQGRKEGRRKENKNKNKKKGRKRNSHQLLQNDELSLPHLLNVILLWLGTLCPLSSSYSTLSSLAI